MLMYNIDQGSKLECRCTTLGAISATEFTWAMSVDPVETSMSIQLIARCWLSNHLKMLKYFVFQKNWYIIVCLICTHSCWHCIFGSLLVSYIVGRMWGKVPDSHEQSGKSNTPLIACLTSKWDLLRVLSIVMMTQIYACFYKSPGRHNCTVNS